MFKWIFGTNEKIDMHITFNTPEPESDHSGYISFECDGESFRISCKDLFVKLKQILHDEQI
jgi:hypothetical protein